MAQSYLLSTLAAQFPEEREPAFLQRYPGPWVVWEPGKWAPASPSGLLGETLNTKVTPQLRRAAPTAALATHLQVEASDAGVTLGRDPATAVPINDVTLSRVHLTFARDGRDWVVTDMGSRNGTKLDGLPLEARRAYALRDGAEIDAGDVLLTFAESPSLYRRFQRAMAHKHAPRPMGG